MKLLSIISFFLFFQNLSALPPPPALAELVKNAAYIAKTNISNVHESKLTDKTIAVSLDAEIIKIYKTTGNMPPKLNLTFIIFPEKFGQWLRTSPPPGEYIIFYIQKHSAKVSANKNCSSPTCVISLYEPHPYAFREWSAELESQLIKTIAR